MSADFVLIARIFVDMRRNEHCEPFLFSRQRYGALNLGASAFCRLNDLLGRLIDQAMVEGFKPDSDYLLIHLDYARSEFNYGPESFDDFSDDAGTYGAAAFTNGKT